MGADDEVVEVDDGVQRADRKEEREGGKPRRHKGEADDVRLAHPNRHLAGP